MHLVNSNHEGPHAGLVTLLSQFFCFVVHRVKLADFVAVPNPLKQHLDFISAPRNLEIVLGDSHLSES